jgi:hypothetical protein
MLNIAGDAYEYGAVVFAVLQECEHRRRGVPEGSARDEILVCAQEKLEEIHATYLEGGGAQAYWDELRHEVLETVMPQYIAAAIRQNDLERSNYEVFRGGDVASRALFALGGLIIALPFIPIFEDMFAFALAVGGWFYPDLKKYMFDRRYAAGLNRLIDESQRYQENTKIHYMTTAQIQEAFVPSESDPLERRDLERRDTAAAEEATTTSVPREKA